MKTEFIPYEQALELKKIEFDEPCFGYYIETKEWIPASYSQKGTIYPSNSDLINGWVSSPLYQQAFKWLYKITKKWIVPIPNDDKNGEWYAVGVSYKTYEEAELACLKKLIEIAKS